MVCLCGALVAGVPARLWLDVPFISQEKNGCGAASAAMVMQYWLKQQSKPASSGSEAAEIQRALYSPEAHGIRASDLEHYFQQQGFNTFTFHGSRDDLRHHLEKGRPLIAALKPESGGMLGRGMELHYVQQEIGCCWPCRNHSPARFAIAYFKKIDEVDSRRTYYLLLVLRDGTDSRYADSI